MGRADPSTERSYLVNAGLYISCPGLTSQPLFWLLLQMPGKQPLVSSAGFQI